MFADGSREALEFLADAAEKWRRKEIKQPTGVQQIDLWEGITETRGRMAIAAGATEGEVAQTVKSTRERVTRELAKAKR
jgi:hypothetical protein